MFINHSLRDSLANSIRPLASFAWLLLLVLFVARVLLVVWQWDRVADADMLRTVFVQGLRFDLLLLGLFLIAPSLMYPVFASNHRTMMYWRHFLTAYLSACFLFAVIMEISTPSFIDQFDSRPNILFVEYLNHPREIAATIWFAYRDELVFGLMTAIALSVWTLRRIDFATKRIQSVPMVAGLLLSVVLVSTSVALVRSTLDHRPVNPSTVALSSDPMVNDLALNSAYTVLYAIYETRHERDNGYLYTDMPEEQAIAEVRQAMHIDSFDFTSSKLPTLHMQYSPTKVSTPKNLVIIIEESLGAEFVGSLGGLPLTPNLDRLSEDGIWFSHLYATGTRSARGIEAIVSGYTPTPARSVVKLPKSQREFFTLAELLSNKGYDTCFIYGGDSQFDNMRRFFVNNGFGRVIDQHDFENPVFVGSWGVSDEDLFTRAHTEFENAGPEPFFSVVFTSSNHSPFQYPDGRIEQYDSEKNTVNNAVKYADYALGEFMRRARSSSYWDDTVFLVVADHNSRVYGTEVMPIERFHIPGLILGGSIGRSQFAQVASQIDLGPTLLSLIGVDSEHPMIGRDLTAPGRESEPGRAIMQFNGTQAYMEGDRVIVMQKDRPVQEFMFENGHLTDSDLVDTDLERRALAHSVWSSIAYQQGLFRLKPKDFYWN